MFKGLRENKKSISVKRMEMTRFLLRVIDWEYLTKELVNKVDEKISFIV